MAETTKTEDNVSNAKHEPKVSEEEGDLKRDSVTSPGDTPKQTGRLTDRSIDLTKLVAKVNGVSSPCWERKDGLAPSTPVRSHMRSTPRGSETPEKGASVPKFGEWDESDPSSADGYTQIFNIVREERQGGAGGMPSMAADTRYSNNQSQFRNHGSKGCFCFPWSGR